MIQRECFLYLINPKDNILLSHELAGDLVYEAAFVCNHNFNRITA